MEARRNVGRHHLLTMTIHISFKPKRKEYMLLRNTCEIVYRSTVANRPPNGIAQTLIIHRIIKI